MTLNFLAAGIVAAQAAGLVGAQVIIDVHADGAVVDASYRIAADTDSVVFWVMRLAGQQIRLTEVVADGVVRPTALEERAGLSWLVLPSERSGQVLVNIRYEVVGRVARVPIIIPDPPTDPGVSDVRIRLRGIEPDARLTDGFPRLSHDGEDVVARPENLPSFVRLPPQRGTISANRVADAAVIVLLILASGYWLYRQRARVRHSSQANPEVEPGR